jgi:predicted transposase/invertase (TIGR01784 family)
MSDILWVQKPGKEFGPKMAFLDALDLNTLEICKDSFVNQDLKEFFSDLLYKVSFGGQTGYIYLLFEHKSQPEKIIGLQLLSYICSIWKLHVKQENLPLPVIVPLVLYHGRENWSGSTDLLHLLAPTDQRLLAYVPNFSYILFDLSQYSDDQIKGVILARVGLLLFKHVFTPGYEKKLPEILSLLRTLLEKQTGMQYIETIIRYILNTAENLAVADLKNIVERNLSSKQGEVIMTLAERIKQEGIQEGIEKGIEKGIQQGIQQGIRQGLLEAIEMGIHLRFGAEGYRLLSDIYRIEDINVLRAVKEAVKNVKTLNELKIVINT